MVNRNLFLFAFTLITLISFGQIENNVPLPIGYTNDFERIYTQKEIAILDSVIKSFEKKTTIQIAIITVDTAMVKKEDFEKFILSVLRTWGVGQKDKNNGILIGISREYRHMRVENGYGIEKILSDEETKKIIDEGFIPFFKEGKYFAGTLNGLRALMRKLE